VLSPTSGLGFTGAQTDQSFLRLRNRKDREREREREREKRERERERKARLGTTFMLYRTATQYIINNTLDQPTSSAI
jgi:hypothetical protein